MTGILRPVVIGMVVVMAGTIPRNMFFALNLRMGTAWPWAVPVTALYLWAFWRYLHGWGPPSDSAELRRASLRANPLSLRQWGCALLAGGLGIVALVVGLRVVNQLVVLPPQRLPDVSAVPRLTMLTLLLAAAPIAGVIEEAAFRGYMQAPLERQYGVAIAILVTGIMFAVAHLDFTPVLLPYYVAVAAIYGMVAYLTNSILPAIVLHTAGNIYSNLDLWLHGEAEWQAPSNAAALIWKTGATQSFWLSVALFVGVAAATAFAYAELRRATRRREALHFSTVSRHHP